MRRVTREDGTPAADAPVILWPFPLAKVKPRAANTVLADADGWFQMESVLEGKYVLTASRIDSGGVFAGAFGSRLAADAAALSVTGAADGCAYSFTLHRQPGYTLRGRTTPPGDSSVGSRRVRMIMTRGEAFPFESSAVVQPDGRFEFRNVPAGKYQFFAGGTGWGDEVNGDRDDVDVETSWSVARDRVTEFTFDNGHAERRTLGEVEANEYLTISALRELYRAQGSYADAYKMGFATNLNLLGPAPEWYRATADRAGLVDERKAGLLPGDDGAHFAEDGYRVTYLPGPLDDKGRIVTYTFSARPIEFGKTGIRSFLLDDLGMIYTTDANRLATREDPVED